MDELLVKPVELAQIQKVLANWLEAAPSAAAFPAPTATPVSEAGPSPAQQASAASALDVRVLAALVGDEPAVIKDFLQEFASSAQSIAVELLAACSAGNAPQVAAQAHKLSASSRAVGAMGLGALCAALEAAAKAGQLDALPALAQRFRAELAAVETALTALLEDNQPPALVLTA